MEVTTVEIETPHGPARAHVHPSAQPKGALVLGHGAGGGIGSPDLVAVTQAVLEQGFTVALVEQPYRVAGRRSSPAAAQLDAAWIAVVERLGAKELRGLPLVAGGRSAGARVACRTAETTGAIGVLCVAFPLRPPRKSGPPAPSRLPELDAVRVPVLVIQGRNDPFGIPPARRGRKVVEVDGTHTLRSNLGPLADAAGSWLARIAARQR